jgi:hypothetical protein
MSLPIFGTWKMVSCETSHPHLPHPSTSTTTFAERDSGIDYRAETVWSDGRASSTHTVFHLDGRWCPLEGSPLADSASLKALGDGTFDGRMKKGDATVGSNHSAMSADGQTLTTRWEVAGPGNVMLVWTTVSTRQ